MYWWISQWILLLSSLVSIANPAIAMMKPGFSYKGHPGSVRCYVLYVCIITFIILLFFRDIFFYLEVDLCSF